MNIKNAFGLHMSTDMYCRITTMSLREVVGCMKGQGLLAYKIPYSILYALHPQSPAKSQLFTALFSISPLDTEFDLSVCLSCMLGVNYSDLTQFKGYEELDLPLLHSRLSQLQYDLPQVTKDDLYDYSCYLSRFQEKDNYAY